MKLLVATFLFSIASALIPVLNVETYLAVVAAKLKGVDDWELALLAGSGQMVGKVIWYYAGVHTMKIPWMRKKMEKPKWQESYDTWHGRLVGRRWYGGLICFLSAASGFPPFAIIAVLAGSLRMPFWVFFSTGLVGRTLRFWAVLAGVGLAFGH